MRRFSRVFLLATSSVVLAASGIVASVSSAGAGPVPVVNSLTIVKTVSGEVPEGTTFTVRVACTNSIIDDGGPVASQNVHFDSTGQPTDTDTIEFFAALGTCTVTETDDGGAASTTYECEGVATAAPAPAATAVAPICPAAGPQEDAITVNKSYAGIDATVTVNNTFTAPTPTTTTAAPSPAASPAIVARANFTG